MIKRRWRTGLLPGLRRPRLPGRQLVPQLERQLPMALRDMRRGPTRRSPLHASALIKHKAWRKPRRRGPRRRPPLRRRPWHLPNADQ